MQQLDEFKKKFNNYSADLEFKTLADLYYGPEERSKVGYYLSFEFLKGKKRKQFLEKFNGMWEYMMACYVLVNTIMYTTNEDDFVQKIEKYKESEELLFSFIEWFERQLIRGKIKI